MPLGFESRFYQFSDSEEMISMFKYRNNEAFVSSQYWQKTHNKKVKLTTLISEEYYGRIEIKREKDLKTKIKDNTVIYKNLVYDYRFF